LAFRFATGLGWILLLVLVTLMLQSVGDPITSSLIYFATWVLSTTVPGVLVWRAVGRPTSLVQELGFGSVLGIGLLLLAWFPATLLHTPRLMWLWPAALIVAFVAVPSLRRHWRPARDPALRTPARWHAAMIVVAGVAFVRLYSVALHAWSLPPKATSVIFQDAWYALGLSQALTRHVTIDDPAAAGIPLRYHWFANAHVSATQSMSGVPAPEVGLHLWLVGMLLTLTLAVAAATERILQSPSGDAPRSVAWWAGPAAALMAVALPAAMFLGEPRLPAINNGFVHSSPSGILATVVVLAVVGPVLDVINGEGRRGSWVLLLTLFALSAGTKPSLLPVFACGGLLLTAAQWLQTKERPRVPILLTVIPVVLIVVAAIGLIGSADGSRLQLFQTLALDPAFTQAAGITVSLPARGGWLTPGLEDGPAGMVNLAIGLFALFVLTELPRLIGILGPLTGALRRDPAVWWCTGVVGSGWCGLWVLAHPGNSQHYFWRIVIPLGVVLTVTTIVRLLPEPRSRSFPAVAAVSLAGLATATIFTVPDPAFDLVVRIDELPADLPAMPDRLRPYAVAALVAVVVILVVKAVSHRLRWPQVPAVALLACFVCSVGAGSAAVDLRAAVRFARADAPVADRSSSRYVSSAEQRAALWLNENSDPDDVVATNVLCVPARYRAHCRHAAFWVSGLTGRQLFIGSWAYTEANLAAYGKADDEVQYQRRRSPWPDRVALSLDAVRSPRPETIAALERRGVRWIFADSRATAVSPRLKDLAKLRYSNREVKVFELRP
jgi:hypothetical protein